MATYADNLIQQTGEIHTYTVDFSDDLPSPGTVTGGTALHLPPSGAGSVVTVSVNSPFVYATLPSQTVTGIHYLDVTGTFNNGDKSAVRIPISVVYPTPSARVGMLALIGELRGLAEAGPSDYKVAGMPYWTDAQIQDVLDMRRNDVIYEPLTVYPTPTTAGFYIYRDYRSGSKFFEQSTGGTEIFYVQNIAGETIPLADYTPDYRRGQILFADDQEAEVFFLTGRSYDLNAAAADIWRRKASHYSGAFDFSTDNHSVTRSQIYQHCLEMAEHFEGLGSQSIQSIPLFRADIDGPGDGSWQETDDAV